jgi:hypothetical protein
LTPNNISFLQDFTLGTSSSQKNPLYPIKLEIPIEVSRSYLISTDERKTTLNDVNWGGYFTSSFSGTHNLYWKFDSQVVDNVLNISTSSTLDNTISNKFSYGYFTSSSAGTYSFVNWDIDSKASGYKVNISTFSSYDVSVPNYTDYNLGPTTSMPFFLVTATHAYLYVYGLTPTTKYYWKVEKLDTGYTDLHLGTQSQSPDFVAGLTQNSYYVTGLSPSTMYYYNVDSTFTYQNTFTTDVSGTSSANWFIDNEVTSYVLDISTASNFDNYQSILVGTTSGPYFTISGSTGSFKFSGLSASTNYYYRVMKQNGEYRQLKYKLDLYKDSYLGKIIEREIFTPDVKYLVQNRQYASVVGSRKTYLEVYKKNISMPSGFATASIFAYDNPSYTEDQNLLIRYEQAVAYLNY